MGNRVLQEDVVQFANHFELKNSLHNSLFLITGATGFIGSTLIRCLLALEQNIRIIAPVRNKGKALQMFESENNSVSFIECDLQTYNYTNIGHVDYIIHCASPTSGKYMENYPLETYNFAYATTYNLLNYAKEYNIKGVVYLSSLEYYGQVLEDKIIDENYIGFVNPCSSRSSYPMGKRSTEYLCFCFANEYNIPVKIARLTQTFGAGIANSDNRVFAQFVRSVINNQDIILHTYGQSSKPYCYSTDCISGILYILLKGVSGEAYNVANESTYISIIKLAELLRDTFNPNIDVRIELNDKMGYAPVTKLRLSVKKLESLGWQPKYELKQMFERLIISLR